MRVGAHGMTHRPLRGLGEPELEVELDHAAGLLGELTGHAIEALACPYGSYDRRVLVAARRCGFGRVYTVDGTARAAAGRADAWLQPRYTVRGCDTVATVQALAARPRGRASARALRRAKTCIKRWR
jgi:peptidoglycan/xylan/chitin deacetylase (PgdA/CDA1 family)